MNEENMTKKKKETYFLSSDARKELNTYENGRGNYKKLEKRSSKYPLNCELLDEFLINSEI